MKRLVILLLTIAGLSALLSGCGGGEETGILALAFRLDGESPIVTAYIGDPDEDPFQPPAGRYYIEALNQNDVVISLGAVEVEEGQVVAFPSSFEAAGGVADAERAQSLKTVATFLIDFELSELIFIEAITGGFTTEDPFDPAVEPDAASVQELLGLYAEMADQQDALEAALSDIEERAVVSASVLYVRSPWAPTPGWPELAKKKLNDWIKSTFSYFHDATVVRQRKRILEIAEQIPEDKREEVFGKLSFDKQGDAASFDDWLEKVRTDDGFVRTEGSGIYYELDGLDHEAVVDSGNSAINVLAEEGPEAANYAKDKVLEAYKSVPLVGKLIDTTEKALELEKWAKQFVEDPGQAMDKAFRDHLQQQLAERWKDYLKERAADLPSLTDTGIDKLAEYLAKKTVEKIPSPPSLRTPAATAGTGASPAVPTPQATPKATPKVTPQVTPSASPSPTVVPTPEVTPDITPSASPAPDTGWIEGYVQGIASGWLDKGYGGIDVAVAADDLRQCLTDRVVNLGLSQDEAIGECPAWLFEPSLPEETPSPEPSPSPPPSPSPSPKPSPSPSPKPSPSPSPKPSPSPSPKPSPSPTAQQITAVGQYLSPAPGCTIDQNTMTLTFDSAGGSGSVKQGEGHWVTSCVVWAECPASVDSEEMHYEGAYDPGSKTFNGTWTIQLDYTYYVPESGGQCEAEHDVDSFSGTWQATLTDGVIQGDHGLDGFPFKLTVQS